jgi:hypothetical protein
MIAKKHYVAAIVVAALVACGATSHADQTFTEKSLKGTWGFSTAGTLLTPAPVPAAAVGLLIFDGSGGCSSEAKLNAGGAVLVLTADTCSYTVNANGTGTQLSTFPGLGGFTTDFVILDGAKEFHFIISGGAVASGVAKKQ